MNCVNCGAFLTDMDLDYCPSCGYNVLIQKKVDYLSKSFYNQGLEKASIRDLSGAIACLKQSLIYDKRNIRARNLLGLVYFETGEVVAALSEWVISKNLQPTRNLASEYIGRLQANGNKLRLSMTPSGNITTRFFCAEKVMRIWPPFSFAGFFLRIPS